MSIKQLVLIILAVAPQIVLSTLPTCTTDLCDYWVSRQYGNVSDVAEGDFMHLIFPVDDVTNLWQLTSCGSIADGINTYGEFEMYFVDDTNFELAMAGKPFKNCTCVDLFRNVLDNEYPVESACVTVEDTIDSYAQPQNALQCDFLDIGNGEEATCSNVLLKCVSSPTNSSSSPACRLGLSVLILEPVPFLPLWSFEYIPVVFGFCLVVVLVSVVSRHLRRQAYQQRMNRLVHAGLLDNGHGVNSYNTGTSVAEGTIVDEQTLPTGAVVAGIPGSTLVASYVKTTPDSNVKIFSADVEHGGNAGDD